MKRLYDTFVLSVGAVFGFLFGELCGLFYALIAFVVLDYATGVIVAFTKKSLSSEVGFEGICKKITIFIVVAVANIIDVHVIKGVPVLRTAALFLFISNEGISLLENAGSMGIPIPARILDVLTQLKQKSTEEEAKDEQGK